MIRGNAMARRKQIDQLIVALRRKGGTFAFTPKANRGINSSCLPKTNTIPSDGDLNALERAGHPDMKVTKGEDTKKKNDHKKETPLMESEGGEGEPKESRGKDEKEEEVGEGKTMVVGVKTEAQSRELLTWALVKVAAPGDRVVAIHVLTSRSSSSSDPEGEGEPAAPVSLAKALDAMLAVYKGFCNLKQIDLKLKICKGTAVRKVLALEVSEFAASKLILGVAKHRRTIRLSSFSIAKYCAKKLPFCSVFAVSNGKIVFQRQAADKNKVHRKDSSKDSTSSFGDGELYCLLPNRGQAAKVADDSNSSPTLEDGSNRGNSAADENATMAEAPLKQNCSIGESVSEPPSLNESKEDEPLAPVPIENSDAPLSCSGMPVVKEIPMTRPSWVLLRRLVFSSRRSSSSSHEGPKNSASQGALRLPSRYSAVHPCRMFMKPSAKSTSNIDEESNDIVPVGTDSTPPSVAVHGEAGVHSKELQSLQEKYSSVCRLFSYKELVNTTSNFSPVKLIGKGGCSRVYKGRLSDGKEVAVKILKPSEDALRDFVSEIEIVTTLHHKNIISLIGFCIENSLVLVSDYLSSGSLDEVLHGEKENKHVLSWSTRYKVALGVAGALDYLHGGSGAETVIHRDVKSSNILLSEDFEPQLSDFGLAKWASTSTSSPTSGVVAGTFGYLAPEYFMYGKVNKKIDVYAFGVVLLELLSGRKPISTGYPKGQESLVMWGGIHTRSSAEMVLKLLQGDDDVVKWARLQVSTSKGLDELDDELIHPKSIIQSHLNLALLDVDDDSLSISSAEHTVDFITANNPMEDYLKGRWSCSSSFN
ncbi:mitogen-activated protein kinase kinase kinase 5 [Cocos nucifera]|uniref:non-specific serine/threonine protein kinase n=1 Tax=Cocos nucifera TaxID=13894 RepID=A0A8K0IQ90_COCNU|nr:mitogen-activated protein kinase kinase kinase 5 [Cocos nucifera]